MSNLFLSILTGFLLALSFPCFQISLFAWAGFICLFFALKKTRSCTEAFLISYVCGMVFFGITVYWIIHVSFIGAVLLLFYLSLYFGVFGFGVKWTENHFENILARTVLISCLWTALEFTRAHLLSGFGWALLGYSQYKHIKLIQIADITGVYGISFFIMFVNVILFYAPRFRGAAVDNVRKFIQYAGMVLLAGILLFMFLEYGENKIKEFRSSDKKILKISAIQGNISQEIKWDRVLRELILNKYDQLSNMAAFDEPDVIVWPETALPGYLDEHDLRSRVSRLSASLSMPFLIGAARFSGEGDVCFNSAAFFGRSGRIEGLYDKLHLVPFGEYLPLRKLLFPVALFYPIANFSGGREYKLFEIKGKSFGVLICFEDIFDSLARNFVMRGADFMINITNDAWFKKSPAAYQHNQALVFRAVENKIAMVRAGNTGPTLFIEPVGTIKSRLINQYGEDLFIDGFLTDTVSEKMPMTFFTKFGNVFAYFCILFFAAAAAVKMKNNKARD